MKLKARWGFLFCLVTGILAIISAFGRTDAALAARASARFHEQFDKSHFGDMHRQASPYLQRRIARGEFVDRLSALRLRLGDNVTVTQINRPKDDLFPDVYKRGAVTFVIEEYSLQSTSDRCSEVLSWMVEDGASRLESYHVACDSLYIMQIP